MPTWICPETRIRKLGSPHSQKRTLQQTDIARFWFLTGPRIFVPLVQQVADAKKLDRARLHALNVLDDPPPHACQGPFAASGSHRALVRRSNGEPDTQANKCPRYPGLRAEGARHRGRGRHATPIVTVARLTLTEVVGEGAAKEIETAKFDPWGGLAAHRPLGEIMRARKVAYLVSQTGREEAVG